MQPTIPKGRWLPMLLLDEEPPGGRSTPVLPRIWQLVAWAKRVNDYVDEHGAPSADAIDAGTREELIAGMDTLSDLLQRCADALRARAGPEPPITH